MKIIGRLEANSSKIPNAYIHQAYTTLESFQTNFLISEKLVLLFTSLIPEAIADSSIPGSTPYNTINLE